MSSESGDLISLPIIDFSSPDLIPGSTTWNLVKSQVKIAAENYGSFQALFKPIPEELQRAINGGLQELFQLPLETKKRNVSDKPFHGYMGPSSPASLFENVGLSEPDNLGKLEDFTSVFWPQGNHQLSKALHSYCELMVELDQIIRKMIVESLKLGKYLDEHMNSNYYVLRLAKYEAPQTPHKVLGLKPHTDKNFLTIFSQNEVDGLEIQSKNGEWIPVKFSPNSFPVVIGESLKAWTNGRLYSPYHRVMMSGNERRYSRVIFCVPKEGYVIRAVEELQDEDNPLLYRPFEYSEYLKRRYNDDPILNKPASDLNHYFGV